MNERYPFGDWIGDIKGEVPGPASKRMAGQLKENEAPGTTYLSEEFPVFWKRAVGSNVIDADGNIFVDLSSAFGVANLGHSNPAIAEAISKQVKVLAHGMGDVHPPSVKAELLEKLAQLFPVPGAKIILSSTGAEAVESALKTAYLATGRPGVISFQNSYHGLTYGALAVGGQNRFREPFLPQIAQFSYLASFPADAGDENPMVIEKSISELQTLLEKSEAEKKPVGAIIVEPMQGRAGIIVPPRGWLKAVRDFASANGLLLIADEIMTGFGRTGARFAVNHEEVVPHLLCVGKALSGTLPFSACIGTGEVMRAWPDSEGEAIHTSTFLGNPLGCVAAMAAIDEYEKRDLNKRAERLGKELRRELTGWKKEFPMIKDVRGLGFALGVELKKQDEEGLGFEVAKRALKKGVILLPAGMNGNVVSLLPALTIAGRQLDWSLSKLREAFREMA